MNHHPDCRLIRVNEEDRAMIDADPSKTLPTIHPDSPDLDPEAIYIVRCVDGCDHHARDMERAREIARKLGMRDDGTWPDDAA